MSAISSLHFDSGGITTSFRFLKPLLEGGPVNLITGERAGAKEDPIANARPADPGQKLTPKETQQKLTPEEIQTVQELQRIDIRVRQHEAAHIRVGGEYVQGGPYFQYQQGPDGKQYAVAGEVTFDTTREKELEATIRKMQTIRAAALAPADPSPQDYRVAAGAAAAEAQASAELAAQRNNFDEPVAQQNNFDEPEQRSSDDLFSTPDSRSEGIGQVVDVYA